MLFSGTMNLNLSPIREQSPSYLTRNSLEKPSKFSKSIFEEIGYSHPQKWVAHRYITCLSTANSHTHHTRLHTPIPNRPRPKHT